MFEFFRHKTDSQEPDNDKKKIFVLLNCYNGGMEYTMERLRQIDAVTDTIRTKGTYDIIAELESDSNQELPDLVLGDVKKIKVVQNVLAPQIGVQKTKISN
ncbi:hypothetical protein [Candidatus Nitrosotenuis aquarius]|uniref:hypothetical protein n=1 Tax=Candidatus Nitrosotenuis aquarius TaxID=1846278 RepID=UPI0013C2E54C|nr:hypothetical protein [Candidatus Nitrosotenuis aquarius]